MAVSASLQPTYSTNITYGDPRTQGQWVDIYTNKNRYVNSQFMTTALLEAGVFVSSTGVQALYGSTLVAKPTAAGSKIVGVTQINPTKIYDWDDTLKVYRYRAGEQVSIATTGDIFMYAETPVEVGDKIYFRHTVDAAKTRIGAVTNAAGIGLELYAQAQFVERITAPGLVAVALLNA